MGPVLVPDLLRRRAAEHPGGLALRAAGAGELTYGEWERRSNAMGRGLVERGTGSGDRLALVFADDRLLDYAVAYLAVLKAGAVAVPAGERFAGAELDRVVEHAGATVVTAAEVAGLEASRPQDGFQLPRTSGDLAEIIYTSGTTGHPRGVACTHGNLLAHDLPPGGQGGGSFLHAFPIGTQAAQEALRVPLRIAGRVAVAMAVFDAEEMCALVARHRIARLQLVPAMAQSLVASRAWQGHDVSSVRRVVLSSAPAPPALFERLAEAFPQATLWNAYALTEAGAARTLVQWDPSRPTAVGYPVGETEVRVAGPSGSAVGPGETGEVWLRRRDTPARWYYRDPEATAEVFGDGWVRTGDLGHLDPDGCLHLTDRKKDIIISGGSNVSSVEVENALYEHPAVVEAAVFGLPHPVLGEDVAAAVVVRSATTERELQDVVRARLAEHKVPHRVLLVDELPHNPSGKVLKSELRRRFAVRPAGAGSVAPRDATEAVVASVWEAVLGRPGVGVEDDFFELGGHSLAAAQIAARLGDAFGVELPVTAVFEAPTVAELARMVRTTAAAAG